MSVGQRLISGLKNAFSYAVHGESTEARDKKLGVAQAVIEFSAAQAPDSSTEYETRLRAALLQSRTSALQSLLDKKIAVTLDTRFSKQQLDARDEAIEGIYYPAAKLVALSDDGTMSKAQAKQTGLLVEKLANLLGQVTPTVNVYAYTVTSAPVYGADGMGGFPVVSTEWGINDNDRAPAAKKNPALATPAAKAPKPN